MNPLRKFGWKDARTVFRKEMRETLRDRRTLMIMVVVRRVVVMRMRMSMRVIMGRWGGGCPGAHGPGIHQGRT